MKNNFFTAFHLLILRILKRKTFFIRHLRPKEKLPLKCHISQTTGIKYIESFLKTIFTAFYSFSSPWANFVKSFLVLAYAVSVSYPQNFTRLGPTVWVLR